MSAENVDIVRRAMSAFTENDFEAWFALASEEIEVYPRAEEPGVRERYVGWDEMLEYVANWFSGWEEYATEPIDLMDHGDYVIVNVREVGIASGTGIRVEDHFAHACKVSDGKIVEWRMYGPVEEAIAAVDALGTIPRNRGAT
jgi:ketosteroid isomerase-like protein